MGMGKWKMSKLFECEFANKETPQCGASGDIKWLDLFGMHDGIVSFAFNAHPASNLNALDLLAWLRYD